MKIKCLIEGSIYTSARRNLSVSKNTVIRYTSSYFTCIPISPKPKKSNKGKRCIIIVDWVYYFLFKMPCSQVLRQPFEMSNIRIDVIQDPQSLHIHQLIASGNKIAKFQEYCSERILNANKGVHWQPFFISKRLNSSQTYLTTNCKQLQVRTINVIYIGIM